MTLVEELRSRANMFAGWYGQDSKQTILLRTAADEIERLQQLCTNVHDRLLRGDSDMGLLKMLETAWNRKDTNGTTNGGS